MLPFPTSLAVTIDATTSSGDQTITDEPQDSLSQLNGGDGLTNCGPRVYTFVDPGWIPATVTITQPAPGLPTFVFTSADVNDHLSSPYTVTIEATLLNYPAVPAV